jgi:hypothetical protein
MFLAPLVPFIWAGVFCSSRTKAKLNQYVKVTQSNSIRRNTARSISIQLNWNYFETASAWADYHERPGEGRERIMARGVHMGRPAKTTVHQRQDALKVLADGRVSQADLARRFNVSQSTISRL